MRDIHKNPTFQALVSEGLSSSNNNSLESFLRIKDGTIKELINGRTTFNGKDQKMVSKIKEGSRYWDRNIEEDVNWFCLISTGIGSNLFEMYIHTQLNKVVFYVNDMQVLYTVDGFGYDYALDRNNIRYDINSRSSLGEIYMTNGRTEPLVFSLKDLVDSRFTNKYFTDFNLELYSINSQSNINVPVFSRLVYAAPGGGLAWGQYVYSFRYVSKEGSTTNWSFPTNAIPVIKEGFVSEVESNSIGVINKHIRNYAGLPAPEVGTGIGIEIKFRVDNKLGYDYIEIKRTDYKRAEGINFTPSSKIIKKLKIETNQFSVVKYIDSVNEDESHVVLSKFEEENNMSCIKSAKALKYVSGRIFLGGVEYYSRTISDEDFELKGNADLTNSDAQCFYFMKDSGRNGFSSAVNCVERKPLWHNEYYSWAIVAWDGNFRPSFARKVASSFRTPKAKEELNAGLSRYYSVPNVEGHDIANTYSANIADYINNAYSLAKTNIPVSDLEIKNIAVQNDSKGTLINANEAGYAPLRPVNISDNRSTHNYSPVYTLRSKVVPNPSYPDSRMATVKVFNPTLRSLGFGLNGINKLPSWAKAFSVVRTKRSGRIICQGLAFYHLVEQYEEGETRDFDVALPCKKSLSEVVFQSPDIENGLVDAKIFNLINANPELYSIELVKPLGFVNEPHYAQKNNILPQEVTTAIDQVLHVNIDNESVDKKILGAPINGTTSGFVNFNHFRNTSSIGKNNTGNTVIKITSVKEEKLGCEGKSRFVIKLDENIFETDGSDLGDAFGDLAINENREFLEPVYIVNIISNVNEKVDSEYEEYESTGNFIKLKSLIGIGSGSADQNFEIVDERIEDFSFTPEESAGTGAPGFVYVDENSNGIYKRIINIKDLSAPTIALVDDDIANGTTTAFGVTIDGKFTCNFSYKDSLIDDTYEAKDKGDIFIKFTEGYNPPAGSRIEVHYDNNKAVKVFGGDCFVGQHVYPIFDRQIIGLAEEGGFYAFRGMPYSKFTFRNDYYALIRSVDVIAGNILVPDEQGSNPFNSDIIRQMIVSYYCESVINTSISSGSFYPSTNYVMRPLVWKQYDDENISTINEEYWKDRPDEQKVWAYGGFKTQQAPINTDYSKNVNIISFYSQSELSFKEKTFFGTRIAVSLQRAINQEISENIKIFRAFNYYDLPDNNGDIQDLCSFSKGGTSGLYIFTKDDIAMTLLDSVQLSTMSGEQLAIIGDDGVKVINSHIWIGEKEKRGVKWQERNTIAQSDNRVFFCNGIDSYVIEDGKITSISDGYKNELEAELFKNLFYENHFITSFFNSREKEYWVSLKLKREALPVTTEVLGEFKNWEYSISSVKSNVIQLLEDEIEVGYSYYLTLNNKLSNCSPLYIITSLQSLVIISNEENTSWLLGETSGTGSELKCYKVTTDFNEETTIEEILVGNEAVDSLENAQVFVYSDVKNKWVAKYTYNFNKFAKIDNEVFGSKEGVAYKLDEGNYLDLKLTANYNPVINKDKEFKMIRLESSRIPSTVNFYDSLKVAHSTLDNTNFKELKESYQSLIPVNTLRKRLQGESFYVEIVDTDETQNLNIQALEFAFKKFQK